MMKRRTIYLLSFFLPFLTLFCGMIYFGVAPFGDKSLLIIDGLHQYMPFFSVLYDKIHAGESLFYTFRTGLGVNFLALYAYYLSSPFNLIIFFFKRSQLNMVVSWILVLKLCLSGLAASIYFTEKSRRRGMHIVAMAVAYALNGYMVGYSWNVMWLDAIMVLPLILLGMERLIEGKGGRLYCLSLFYALYCNYYIAFMICIFCVIWYLFYHFTSVKQFFVRGFSFAGYSFLAAGLAGIMLIPAYLGIKQTASGGDMGLPGHSWLGDMWTLLARQYDMGYPIAHDNFDGTANLFFGIFAVIFALLYLMNRRISLLEKGKKILLIVFFYVSFNEEILNFIWHGFHNQYGIPNRFSFLYGFVLLTMAFEVLENRDDIRLAEPVLAVLAALAMLGGAYHFEPDELPLEVLCSAAFLLLSYGIILFLARKWSQKRAFFQSLTLAVIIGEMMVTCLLGFDTNGQIKIPKFFSATQDMEEAISLLDDGTFYRSELADNKMVDESTWYPMNAISLFGSTAQDATVEMMDSLGFHTGCNEYLYKGATPVTDLMLNMRYLYYHEADDLHTSYPPVGQYGGMKVYENPTQGMSIGYAIHPDIEDWYYNSSYPFRVLNDFCEQGYQVEEVFETIDIYDPETDGCSVTGTNDGEYYFEYKKDATNHLIFQVDVEKTTDDLYIFYDGTQVENVSVSVDQLPLVNGDLDSRMIPLGHVDGGSTLRIAMKLKGETPSGYVRLSAAYFHPERYAKLAEKMTSQAFEMTDRNDHHIEGKIRVQEESPLFFSIPYDEGWTVKVDGKNTETMTIGNAFLSVIIPKGEHQVVLDYTPQGFRVGILCSGGSLVLLILLSIVLGIRRKKATGGKENEEIWLENENDSSPDGCHDDCDCLAASDGEGGCS